MLSSKLYFCVFKTTSVRSSVRKSWRIWLKSASNSFSLRTTAAPATMSMATDDPASTSGSPLGMLGTWPTAFIGSEHFIMPLRPCSRVQCQFSPARGVCTDVNENRLPSKKLRDVDKTVSVPCCQNRMTTMGSPVLCRWKNGLSKNTLLMCTCTGRNFATTTIQSAAKGPSLLTRMLWKIGIGKLRYNKTRMRIAGYKLYMCCDELVDHFEVTQVLALPDTFYSWYLSMELHVWLLMVRLQQEGDEGKFVKHMLVKALWDDVENRSKRLGHAAQTSARRVSIKEIGDHFQAALFAYDEGALGDDRILGAAIWRIIFEMDDVDPVLIELLVAYIRKQLRHLDGQRSEEILDKGLVTFLPLYGDEELMHCKGKLEKIKARNV